MDLVQSSTASNTALVAADYQGTVGNTALQSDTQPAFSAITCDSATYTDYLLNVTGRGNISLTGITKFGVKGSSDRTNTAPTWSSNLTAGKQIITAETAGTSTDPKLAVTYTAAGGVGRNFYLMMLGVGQ